MGLDIPNGYRLDVRRSRSNEHSFESVHEVIAAFKQAARPVAQTLVNKRAAYLCTRIIDQRVLEIRCPIDDTDVPEDWSPVMGAMSILLHRYGQTFDGEKPSAHYAFDAHVTIIPAGGEVLAIVWAQQPALIQAWADTEGVLPFPYWESWDRPHDVCEEEWAMRETIWADACGDESWAVAGFTTEVLGRWGVPIPHIDGIMAYIPPLHDRALLYAMERVVSRRYRQLNPRADDELQRMIAFDQAIRWVKGTRDGNAALQVEREDIEEVLPAISASMLVHEPELAELPQ